MSTLTTDEHSKLVQNLRIFGAVLGTTSHWRSDDEPLPPDPAAQRGGARLLVELFGVMGARRLFQLGRHDGDEPDRPDVALDDATGEKLDVLRGMAGLVWLACAAAAGDQEVRETLGL
jgi:hypothetical protein